MDHGAVGSHSDRIRAATTSANQPVRRRGRCGDFVDTLRVDAGFLLGGGAEGRTAGHARVRNQHGHKGRPSVAVGRRRVESCSYSRSVDGSTGRPPARDAALGVVAGRRLLLVDRDHLGEVQQPQGQQSLRRHGRGRRRRHDRRGPGRALGGPDRVHRGVQAEIRPDNRRGTDLDHPSDRRLRFPGNRRLPEDSYAVGVLDLKNGPSTTWPGTPRERHQIPRPPTANKINNEELSYGPIVPAPRRRWSRPVPRPCDRKPRHRNRSRPRRTRRAARRHRSHR